MGEGEAPLPGGMGFAGISVIAKLSAEVPERLWRVQSAGDAGKGIVGGGVDARLPVVDAAPVVECDVASRFCTADGDAVMIAVGAVPSWRFRVLQGRTER